MAKYLCLFALAGLAAGAPSPAAVRVSANDQEAVISSIMLSLQPSIDAAINAALGQSSFTVTTTQETLGPVQISGSVGNANYDGSFGAEQSSFTSSYETSSNTANQGQIVGQTSQEGGRYYQSAGLNGVVYHDGSSQNQNAVSGSQQTVSTFTQEVASNQGSSFSTSANQQQQVVQGVMTALVPSIEAAVQAALANFQQQQTSVASSTFSTGSQQAVSSAQSAQLTGVNTVSTTAQISAAEEQALVTKIIQVLTPSITASVRKALASRVQTVQVQTVQAAPVAVSQQNFAANQQSFAANQQASFGSSSSSAFNTQSASTSSSVNQSNLVAQIIAALQPSIALSVQEALDASRVSSVQTVQTQGLTSQAINSGFSAQSASSGSSSSSFNAGSSGSLSSESLSSIFGNGGVHNVKVETPEYKIEYNN